VERHSQVFKWEAPQFATKDLGIFITVILLQINRSKVTLVIVNSHP
jgi:hypothetical protein